MTSRGIRAAAVAVLAATLLAALALGSGAYASVLEVSTSTPAPSRDGGQRAMEQAVRTAVETVLRETTTGFTPTLVVLTRAVVIGNRLYLRLLLTDEEGMPAFRDPSLRPDDAAPADPRGRELQL